MYRLPSYQNQAEEKQEKTSINPYGDSYIESSPIIDTRDSIVLQNADKRYLRFLYDMWSTLKQPRIDLKQLNSVMQCYNEMQKDYQEEYLNVLFNPERQANAKIPSLFPVPSSSFLSHQQVSITTNASGNISFTWNPFFLQDAASGANQSTFFVNNNSTLTGSSSNDNFFATDIGYNQLPGGLYSQYRVVGASIVVTYTGRMDIVSGVIGIGIGLNQYASPNIVTTGKDSSSQVFGNFNLIDDLYFSKRTQAVNGCRAIYFPLDNRFLQFTQMATSVAGTGSVNGFYFAFYGANLPASSPCLRVDFYIQYECTVKPEFNGYLTQSPGQYSNKNWLETTSQIIHRNPGMVTQTTSDVPDNVAGVGGFMDFATKLLGGAKKLLNGPVGDAIQSIPGVGKIAEMAKAGVNLLTPETNNN